MVLFVLVLLGMAAVLGAVYAMTSSGLQRDEHRSAVGEMASVIANNMIDEAFYAVWNRVNAPVESAKYKVDVYRRLRDAKIGQVVRFEVPPLLAWRTALAPGAKLDAVQVAMRLLEYRTETKVTYTRPPANPKAPAGTQRRRCYSVQFVPVVTQRKVAVGDVTFKARVTLDAGAGMTVTRQLEVGHEVRVGEVSAKPKLTWIDMVPIRSWQLVDREVKK